VASLVVHERPRSGDERLETGDDGIAGEPATGESEIGRAGAVERAEAANTVGAERLRAASGACEQRVELVPARPALVDEDVEVQVEPPLAC
jgi:hypothetical protein